MHAKLNESLSLKGRIALKKYCEETPVEKRSWSDFKNYNEPGITESEYNYGIDLFGKIWKYKDGSNPSPVATKPEVNTPKEPPKVTPKVEPKVEPKAEPKPIEKSSDNGKKVIDGFELSTAKTFHLTETYIKRRYAAFNNKYFGGELPTIPVRLSKSKNAAGCYHYVWRGRGNAPTIVSEELCVSIFMMRDENTFCNTLLHEMIHVYQVHILKLNLEYMKRWAFAHGSTFTNKAEEISKFGWNINVKVTKEESEAAVASSEQINKLKRSGRILMFIGNNLLCCIERDKVSYYKSAYRRYPLKFYEIIDHAKFVQYPMCKSAARGRGSTPEAVQGMIDNNQIRPIDSLNESVKSNISFAEDLPDIVDGMDAITIRDDGDVHECVMI